MTPCSSASRVGTLLLATAATGWIGAAVFGQSPVSAPPTTFQPLPKPSPLPNGKPSPGPVKLLSLADCLAIAEANHPAIKMAEASLSQSIKGSESLEKLPGFANWVKPELPFRRQQSSRGIDAAAANVTKTKQEVTSDVCRMYYTFVYAKQQDVIVTEIVEQLLTYRKVVEDVLKQPVNPNDKLKISKLTLLLIIDALGRAKSKQIFAQAGKIQALAALKQAMGVDPVTFEGEPKDTELPIMAGTVTQEQIVEFAMTRRAELMMSAAAVDAFRLEVCAQDKNRFGLQVNTFASGTDLHANAIPHAIRNGEYKPGATAPELTSNLFGSRTDRVSRAIDFSRRQDAQYEQVVSLVKLEAVNAYLTWKRTSEQMAEAKIRFDAGKELAELTRQNTGNVTQVELLQNFVQSGLAQSDYLEAVYEHVKSMIALERITAGAVKAGFPGR
jgi:outer membrane protein TolC